MAGFCIAIDGPAASGKGTIATGLGRELGFPVLDSGLLYRAVGVTVQREGGDPADAATAQAVARRLDPSQLDDPAFRTREAGEAASVAAAHPGVRAALKDFQQRFAALEPGAVIDGRDIGTVIAPDAPAKIFVTASPEVRAERRHRQLVGQGERVAYDDILADIRRRDERDSGRAASPLVRASDAALLDTTQMTISQAADAARRIVEAARARWEASLEG
jgi:cytidylate kinase